MSFFQTIRGERYDRTLLTQLEAFLQEEESGELTETEAGELLEALQDGETLTETDLKTLQYVLDHFPLNKAAHELISERLRSWKPGPLAARLKKAVRLDFGLTHLDLSFSDEELELLNSSHADGMNFEEAVREILFSWLTQGLHPLSPYAVIMNYYELYPGEVLGWEENLFGYLRAHFNEATLDLPRREDWTAHQLNPDHYWGLRLRLHQLPRFAFFGFVARDGRQSPFSLGQEVEKSSPQQSGESSN